MGQVTENFIPQTDHFSESFRKFQDSRQFKRLQDKYKVRPFFERQRPLKVISDIGGYVLGVFSAATAFLFVWGFVQDLLSFKVLSAVFAVAFLVGLEALKRLTLPGVFKTFFQFRKIAAGQIAFAVFLSVASIASSYFGAKQAVKMLTPEVQLVSLEDVRKPYEERLRTLQADKADAMKQTWKGKQTVQAAKRLNTIQNQEAEVQAAMLRAVQGAQTENSMEQQAHTADTHVNAEAFAGVTLVFELLMVLCLWYAELYDFRSLAEFAAHTRQTEGSGSPHPTPNTEPHTKPNALNGRPVIAGFQTNAMRYAGDTCLHCKQHYERRTSWQKYCSTSCRIEAHAEKHGQPFDPKKRFV
jgi:hypothetical protein